MWRIRKQWSFVTASEGAKNCCISDKGVLKERRQTNLRCFNKDASERLIKYVHANSNTLSFLCMLHNKSPVFLLLMWTSSSRPCLVCIWSNSTCRRVKVNSGGDISEIKIQQSLWITCIHHFPVNLSCTWRPFESSGRMADSATNDESCHIERKTHS